MYTSDIDYSRRSAKAYLIAAAVIAAAAQVYGLFSHGVHSAFMTFAFAIPLILGAVPYLAAAWSAKRGGDAYSKGFISGFMEKLATTGFKDTQLAVIATLTAGSLLKGALDIYGTTNRLLIAYPLLAAALIIAVGANYVKKTKK